MTIPSHNRREQFGARHALTRLAFAFVLVFATYNPFGYSYFDWLIASERQQWSLQLPLLGEVFVPYVTISAEKILAGLLLLAGWIISIRATSRSIGLGALLIVGIVLTIAWMAINRGWIEVNFTVIAVIINIVTATVLGIGLSWSHFRRRISGQTDVDDIDEE